MNKIKNIVFDFGNVLFDWSPIKFTNNFFPNQPNALKIFESDEGLVVWKEYNKGTFTRDEIVEKYIEITELDKDSLEKFFEYLPTAIKIYNNVEKIVPELANKGYKIYGLTDNFKDFINLINENHANLMSIFNNITISYNLGVLKPSDKMFEHLINTNSLNPEETIYFDDVEEYVNAARKHGIEAYRTYGFEEVTNKLKELNII